MGNTHCTCISKTKNYLASQKKKKKKPPKPEEIKISEGVKNANGQVIRKKTNIKTRKGPHRKYEIEYE